VRGSFFVWRISMSELPVAMQLILENKRVDIVAKYGQELFDKALAGELRPSQLKMLLGGVASPEKVVQQ
jgi:hypothetical protein